MKIVFRFLIPLIILLCIDLYSFQAIKTADQNLGKSTRKWIAFAFWSVTAITLGMFVTTMFRDFFTWPKYIRVYLTGVLAVIYLTKLFLVIFLLADDLIRLVKWVISKLSGPREPVAPDHVTISRSLFLSQAALVVAAVPFASLIYGMVFGAFDYKVRRLKMSFSNLPPAFDGLKILQLSDIHSGSFVETEHLQRAVNMVNAEKADIVFFTGDLVNNRTDEVYPFMDVLKQIRAPMGVYSSLGNHDYGDYASWPTDDAKHQNLLDLYEVHKKLGWMLMRNENRIIARGDQRIAIAGVENWGANLRFPRYGDLNKASAGLQNIPFTLLMSHDPSHWDAQILAHPHKFDLTLAGHTHGAQFGVDTKLIKWSPIQYFYKQWAGLYKQGEKFIYVNRGLGFLGYPGRAGISPEITVIELKTKA
jgi:predicted MPP superfamily phosphohydrolase